jgi:hypothetical protein
MIIITNLLSNNRIYAIDHYNYKIIKDISKNYKRYNYKTIKYILINKEKYNYK